MRGVAAFAAMGVTHSMDEAQVSRISTALQQSAKSIKGINSKFDIVDEHWQGILTFNSKISMRVEDSLGSFQRLDKAIDARVGKALTNVKLATDELMSMMRSMVTALEAFDVQSEINDLPKAVIPLLIPIVVIMIELAVANAYLGILLTRLPDVGNVYSSYLLANAAIVLLGLSLSLLWLVSYRCFLSCRTRPSAQLQRLSTALSRTRASAGSEESDELPSEEMDTGHSMSQTFTEARIEQLSESSREDESAASAELRCIREPSAGPRQRRSKLGSEGKKNSPEVEGAQVAAPTTRGVKVSWEGGLQAHALWGTKKEKSPPRALEAVDAPPLGR